MDKWEYKIVPPDLKHFTHGRREEMLNELGSEGWELVAATEGVLYFKRPLPTQEK